MLSYSFVWDAKIKIDGVLRHFYCNQSVAWWCKDEFKVPQSHVAVSSIFIFFVGETEFRGFHETRSKNSQSNISISFQYWNSILINFRFLVGLFDPKSNYFRCVFLRVSLRYFMSFIAGTKRNVNLSAFSSQRGKFRQKLEKNLFKAHLFFTSICFLICQKYAFTIQLIFLYFCSHHNFFEASSNIWIWAIV